MGNAGECYAEKEHGAFLNKRCGKMSCLDKIRQSFPLAEECEILYDAAEKAEMEGNHDKP